MMLLLSVASAAYTATDGVIDLVLTADLGQGEVTLPFTFSPADPHGLAPLVGAWLADHPGFPIAAYEPTPPPTLTRIPKDFIWRRATDPEAEIMRSLLDGVSVRLREIYNGALWINTTDELYGVLHSALVAAFGEARAAELLEPVE